MTTLPLRNPLVYVLGKPLVPPRGWAAERSRQLAAAAAGLEHHHHQRQQGGRPAREEAGQDKEQSAGAGGARGLHRRRGAGGGAGGGEPCGEARQREAVTSAPAPPPSAGRLSSGVVVPQVRDPAGIAGTDCSSLRVHWRPSTCGSELVTWVGVCGITVMYER